MAQREIDDVIKRKLYKDKKFGDKSAIKDAYTGKLISYEITDDDHVTPIAIVPDRYSDLLKEQQKTMANRGYNQALTSANVNRSKGALENHQYIQREARKAVKSFRDGDFSGAKEEMQEVLQKAPRMLGHEMVSRTGMAVEGNFYRAGNLSKQATQMAGAVCQTGMNGASSAVKASMVHIVREGIEDVVKVSTGEIALEEAVKDMGTYTAKIAAGGAVSNIGKQQLETVLQKASSKTVGKLLSPEVVGTTIAIATTTVDIFAKYVNGEIDIGQAMGEMIISGVSQGIQAILLNPDLGIVGAGALPATAAVFSVMLISSACSYIVDGFQSFNNYKSDVAVVSKIIQDAEREISNTKKTLQEICDREIHEVEEKTKGGYKIIIEAIAKNDIELAEQGMNKILELAEKKVIFSGASRDEFCAVLFDK